jgi:hypothetical protein
MPFGIGLLGINKAPLMIIKTINANMLTPNARCAKALATKSTNVSEWLYGLFLRMDLKSSTNV